LYEAEVVRVVDGDTLDVVIDLGLRVFHRTHLRLIGVNTPEVFGVKQGTPEYEAGKRASDFTAQWLSQNCGTAWKVQVETHKSEKYGRWLAVVTPIQIAGAEKKQSLNNALVAQGWGA
jgi:micrococcal nuclease